MPSTYTDRNRLEMQAPGENSDAWGEILNDGVIALLDASLDGMVSFTLSGSKTLSDEDGDTDESRCRFLNITSGTGGTVTIPDVEKWYLVRNSTSGTVTITTGTGTSGDVAAGGWAIVVSTGANTVFAINLTASPAFTGTPTAPTAASGTATTQIATTAFVDELYDVGVVSKSSSFTLALTDRATVIDYIGGAGDDPHQCLRGISRRDDVEHHQSRLWRSHHQAFERRGSALGRLQFRFDGRGSDPRRVGHGNPYQARH
jgi:hypothetical protein